MPLPPSEATKIHLENEAGDPRQARVELAALIDKFNQLLNALDSSAFSTQQTTQNSNEANLPTATIMDFFLPDAPTGWIELDGKYITRSSGEEYYDLFSTLFNAAKHTPNPIPNLFTTHALTHTKAIYAWNQGERLRLPNLNGRTRIAKGGGTGLTTRAIGQTLGKEKHYLHKTELPRNKIEITNFIRTTSGTTQLHFKTERATSTLSTSTPSNTTKQLGLGHAHNNMQPSFVVTTCIKL